MDLILYTRNNRQYGERWYGPAEEIALRMSTTPLAHPVELLLGLNSLGCDVDAQCEPHGFLGSATRNPNNGADSAKQSVAECRFFAIAA